MDARAQGAPVARRPGPASGGPRTPDDALAPTNGAHNSGAGISARRRGADLHSRGDVAQRAHW
eukprot:2155457-Lingulodinium_polyedra.AAC.1